LNVIDAAKNNASPPDLGGRRCSQVVDEIVFDRLLVLRRMPRGTRWVTMRLRPAVDGCLTSQRGKKRSYNAAGSSPFGISLLVHLII